MSQENSAGNAYDESAKKAILERLSYPNLTLDDLRAAKAFSEVSNSKNYIIDDILMAEEHFKSKTI